MANITKTFTYALPDEYVAQTSDLNLTAEWTYEGPAFMWVFVDNWPTVRDIKTAKENKHLENCTLVLKGSKFAYEAARNKLAGVTGVECVQK